MSPPKRFTAHQYDKIVHGLSKVIHKELLPNTSF